MKGLQVVIKGAGEMATGIAHRLFMSNITCILMTEIGTPISVRRNVAFSEAVYEGEMVVEGVKALLVKEMADIRRAWEQKLIGVIVDPGALISGQLKPDVVIDAIMTKRGKGSIKGEAPFTVGVGPGFRAPETVDAVVESNRGHNLGKVIYHGEAEAFTGIPGVTAGYSRERVLRAPHAGMVRPVRAIGDVVERGETVLLIDTTPVIAQIGGIVRGLIRPISVRADEKIGDIDPRTDKNACYTISEKARAIGGGVLEAVMHRFNDSQMSK
jgi:xanthine dehydrogenase accessory factor